MNIKEFIEKLNANRSNQKTQEITNEFISSNSPEVVLKGLISALDGTLATKINRKMVFLTVYELPEENRKILRELNLSLHLKNEPYLNPLCLTLVTENKEYPSWLYANYDQPLLLDYIEKLHLPAEEMAILYTNWVIHSANCDITFNLYSEPSHFYDVVTLPSPTHNYITEHREIFRRIRVIRKYSDLDRFDDDEVLMLATSARKTTQLDDFFEHEYFRILPFELLNEVVKHSQKKGRDVAYAYFIERINNHQIDNITLLQFLHFSRLKNGTINYKELLEEKFLSQPEGKAFVSLINQIKEQVKNKEMKEIQFAQMLNDCLLSYGSFTIILDGLAERKVLTRSDLGLIFKYGVRDRTYPTEKLEHSNKYINTYLFSVAPWYFTNEKYLEFLENSRIRTDKGIELLHQLIANDKIPEKARIMFQETLRTTEQILEQRKQNSLLRREQDRIERINNFDWFAYIQHEPIARDVIDAKAFVTNLVEEFISYDKSIKAFCSEKGIINVENFRKMLEHFKRIYPEFEEQIRNKNTQTQQGFFASVIKLREDYRNGATIDEVLDFSCSSPLNRKLFFGDNVEIRKQFINDIGQRLISLKNACTMPEARIENEFLIDTFISKVCHFYACDKDELLPILKQEIFKFANPQIRSEFARIVYRLLDVKHISNGYYSFQIIGDDTLYHVDARATEKAISYIEKNKLIKNKDTIYRYARLAAMDELPNPITTVASTDSSASQD